VASLYFIVANTVAITLLTFLSFFPPLWTVETLEKYISWSFIHVHSFSVASSKQLNGTQHEQEKCSYLIEQIQKKNPTFMSDWYFSFHFQSQFWSKFINRFCLLLHIIVKATMVAAIHDLVLQLSLEFKKKLHWQKEAHSWVSCSKKMWLTCLLWWWAIRSGS